MMDMLERLRSRREMVDGGNGNVYDIPDKDCEEAAVEIERLRSRLAGEALPADVAELVIAARIVAFEDQSPEALKRLDRASEMFADRVKWDGEPPPTERPKGCPHCSGTGGVAHPYEDWNESCTFCDGSGILSDRLEERPARHDEGEELDALGNEIVALRHDLERALATSTELATEVSSLSARNKELEAALAKTDGATPAPRTDFYKW